MVRRRGIETIEGQRRFIAGLVARGIAAGEDRRADARPHDGDVVIVADECLPRATARDVAVVAWVVELGFPIFGLRLFRAMLRVVVRHVDLQFCYWQGGSSAGRPVRFQRFGGVPFRL